MSYFGGNSFSIICQIYFFSLFATPKIFCSISSHLCWYLSIVLPFFTILEKNFLLCQDIPNFSRIKVPKLSHEIWAVLPPAHSPLSHIIYYHLFHMGGPWSTTGIILPLMPLIDTSLDQVKRTCTKYGPKWARAKYILVFLLVPQVL